MTKKKIWLFAVCGFCLLCILAGIIAMSALRNLLPDQQAAERWQGESETRFAQVSVFTTIREPLTEDGINSFRSSLDKKLSEAGLSAGENGSLWADAFCAMGTASAAADRASVTANTLAVGGDFFLFHPLPLIDGQYIAGDDLMKDRVLVNEMLAWKLYGGRKIAGMSVTVNGIPCTVAGVFDLEDNFATELAIDREEPLMIMAHDLYAQAENAAPITVYEIVMPNPLTDFARQTVEDSLGKGAGAETLENTSRFSGKTVRAGLKNFAARGMRKTATVYPYWENAARGLASHLSLLWLLTALFCILPILTALCYLVRLFILCRDAVIRGRKRLSEKIEAARERRWTEKNGSSQF